MLRIRLRRVGKKKRPVYRVVVADSRAPQRGAFIETIGLYDPLTEPATVNIDQEKAQKWLQQGARPSETVAKLLARQGLLPAKAPAVPEATAAPETSEAAEPSAPAE
ncbi:MAG: 30S ribosomal protein S16 [Dehalococcoidia bacterium]|nr:30S ribosomal protein S16 [Dehalococcoidia bacterium]